MPESESESESEFAIRPTALHPGGPVAGTRVLLLRHAETAQPGQYHGAESDVPLGERGQAQAQAAAQALAGRNLGIEALYATTLQRSQQTARPIAGALGLDLRIALDLHERRMGSLSGQPHAQARPIYEATRDRWHRGDLDATHPGGESFRQIQDRVVPAFRALVAAHPGQTILVVAHGVVIRVLLCTLLPDAGPQHFEQFGIDFVAVNDLHFDGASWRAAALNRPATTFADPASDPHRKVLAP